MSALDVATKVVKTLTSRDLSLSTAESLTGGLLGAAVTEVPGASKVYLGGIVAYDTRMKPRLLEVDPDDIAAHSVVSPEIATDMASGVQGRTGSDWAIGVTGVAGPDPQEGHDPGEVWICVLGPRIASLPQFQQTERFQFEGEREAVRAQTVDAAFTMLLRVVSPV